MYTISLFRIRVNLIQETFRGKKNKTGRPYDVKEPIFHKEAICRFYLSMFNCVEGETINSRRCNLCRGAWSRFDHYPLYTKIEGIAIGGKQYVGPHITIIRIPS